MASLTSYKEGVAGIDSGAIKPLDFKSPIELGLDAAGDALKAWRTQDTMRRQDAAARDAASLDQIAQTAFQIDVKANNAMLPSSVQNAKAQLDNTRNAVDQGVMPQVAYQTQLQNAVDRAMADNPEAAYEIATYMRTSGHDHFMFRQLEQEQARSTAISNAVNSADSKALEYARARGTNPNLPVSDQIAAGYTLQQADFMMDQAQKQATAALASKQAGKADAEFQMNQANKTGMNGVQQWLSGVTMPLYNQMNALISAAGQDEAKLNRISTNMIPLLDNATNSAIASSQQKLIEMGIATPENVALIKTQITNMNEGLKAVFTDRSGSLQRAVQNLQNQYNIDVTRAAPLIFKYSKLVGTSAMADLLGPTSMIDEKLQKQLKLEWQGVAEGGSDATLHFNNIIQIMKGDKTLKDFTETEARAYIGSIVSGKRGSEKAILEEGASIRDTTTYFNTYGNLLNATNDFTPASDAKDLKNATNLVFTRNARLALDKLAAKPETREQAEAMGMASHGESIKMIQNLLGGRDQDAVDIKYDSNKGVFVFTDKQRNAADRAIARNLSTNYDRVDALNQALDHAVKTSKYDPNLPKGVTPKQLRDAYATNTPIRDKDGKVLANPDEVFDKAATSLEQQLRETPLTIQRSASEASTDLSSSAVSNPAPQPAQGEKISFPELSDKLPLAIAEAQIMQESGGDPTAVSNQGAVGIAQIVPKWFPQYDAKKLASDKNYALTAYNQIMTSLIDKHNGSVPMALGEYHGGPDFKQWGPKTFDYVAKILKAAEKKKK